MRLNGVRRQLAEAREALVESAGHAAESAWDPAYRKALRSRNLLFHATRGIAAARGEPLPEMPAVGIAGGGLAHHAEALAAIDAALAVEDDPAEMPPHLAAAKTAYAPYLGWLREAVGTELRAGRKPAC
jgi:hypothetical protein